MSVEKRNIDLLVISSQEGKYQKDVEVNQLMFPKKKRNSMNQIQLDLLNFILFYQFLSFQNKKAVFLSARVHPGELPSSHMLNGVIQFLLSNYPESQILRQKFVFYLVPILNPDGVYRGHYRTDIFGSNLNRCYITPDINKQPSIYFVKEFIIQLATEGLFELYIDLHAHATKQGCFFFGNQMDFRNQQKIQMFAKLMSLHNPILDYANCNFTEWNMYQKDKQDTDNSKEGSGRVGIFKATNIPLCFTLECNYNNGKRGQELILNNENQQKEFNIDGNSNLQDKIVQQLIFQTRTNSADVQNENPYNLEKFESIGKSICLTILEFYGLSPNSFVQQTIFCSSKVKFQIILKLNLAVQILKSTPFRFDKFLRQFLKNFHNKINVGQTLQHLLNLIEKNIEVDYNFFAEKPKENIMQNVNQKKPTSYLKKLIVHYRKIIPSQKVSIAPAKTDVIQTQK